MIKDIVKKNNSVSINSIHKQKIDEIVSKFKDSNNNFDLENFIKYLNEENVKVIREGYSLNFLGKRAAELQSALDSTTVFEPDKEHNSKPENKDSENIYISADNLEALRHLKKSYHNRIKCIYIDPPYNTGNDGFCNTDKFKYDKDELAEKLGIDVTEAERILNMESSKSNSHSAWLSFMYARLLIAYELLSDDGAIFISIDKNEQSNLKLICDEVFGEDNFIDSIIWEKKSSAKGVPPREMIVNVHEYVLVYSKNKNFKFTGEKRDPNDFKNPDNDPRGPWRESNIKSTTKSKDEEFTIRDPKTGKEYTNTWAFSKESLEEMIRDGRILWKESLPKQKEFLNDMTNENKAIKSSWGIFDPQSTTVYLKNLIPEVHFDNPKPLSFMRYLLTVASNENDIILDFFGGSGTTAQAIQELNAKDNFNRRFIMVQIKEPVVDDISAVNAGYDTIDKIGIERIRRAAKKIKDETNADIDYGFKHYTLIDKKDTLDTLEKFDLNFAVLTQDDILSEFSIESRLITFLCDDGFGLNAKYEEIDIAGFKGYLIDGFLYLLDKGFDSSQIASLIEKVDKKEIVLRKIVIFGYAFDTRSLQQLKDNAEKMGLNDNKDIIVKY